MTALLDPPDVTATGFAALGLSEALIDTLTGLGYEEPTPVQREAIPPLLAGRDVLGQAATGTGKTAAFALPLLQRLAASADAPDGVAVLVLVPTRELARQVAQAVQAYSAGSGLGVLAVYGGAPMEQQSRALRRGADVVVATPGRALDHLRRGALDLAGLQVLVLDEADEMLDMGFEDELRQLLEATPPRRQTALFSATVPSRIRAIAAKHLTDPVQVRIAATATEAGTVPRVRQVAYLVPRAQKLAALGRVLDMEAPLSTLVFCRTRLEVDELTERLNGRGHRAEALHGGLSQEQRERVLRRFRANTSNLLVATDVAARGLDIDHLALVVNYDVPSAPEAYVHRTGRTGRAGREGLAVTIAEPREQRLLRNIEHLTKQHIAFEPVPTVAQLRARRLERIAQDLHGALEAGGEDLDRSRAIVDALADRFDPRDVAAAAITLARLAAAGGQDDEQDIPVSAPHASGHRQVAAASAPGRSRKPQPPRGNRTRLFIAAGRESGVRPGDLVGAIANEARVEGSVVGAIEIADRFSLVDVPAELADDIARALRGSTIKGRRVAVRLDREAPSVRR